MKAGRGNNRLILIVGFGGLLLLLAFAGIDGLRTLLQIESSNDGIRDDFLLRTRVLERIRGDVYVSGTYVRDYLLEPESGKAEGHRYSLLETRNDMDAALAQYRGLLNAQEAGPFQALTATLADYWKELEPVFSGTRIRTSAKLKEVGAIRNDLFHFKREITMQDHETLAILRNWLLSKIKQAEAHRKTEVRP